VKKLTLALTSLLLFYSPANAVNRITQDQNRIPNNTIIEEIKNENKSDQRQLLCLALNVYHEARGATQEEQMMVAKVTINRANLNRWPPNICEVVYQTKRANGRTVAQFSWITTIRNVTPREPDAWRLAQRIAYLAYIDADIYDRTYGATYFYSKQINRPSWARNMEIVGTQNTQHVFLKEKNED
jgi:N-acetylmuramoyl-L-alanine amidase